MSVIVLMGVVTMQLSDWNYIFSQQIGEIVHNKLSFYSLFVVLINNSVLSFISLFCLLPSFT